MWPRRRKFRLVARTILLVDDDPDIRALLGEYLTGLGYVIYAARDGKHALQVLSHIDAPDLILLDYKMPVMNGSQFLARKRWNPRLRCIPVVLLSAWTREWSGTKLGAVEVLSKPVDLERLTKLVERICAGASSIRVRARAADSFRRIARRPPETPAAAGP